MRVEHAQCVCGRGALLLGAHVLARVPHRQPCAGAALDDKEQRVARHFGSIVAPRTLRHAQCHDQILRHAADPRKRGPVGNGNTRVAPNTDGERVVGLLEPRRGGVIQRQRREPLGGDAGEHVRPPN